MNDNSPGPARNERRPGLRRRPRSFTPLPSDGRGGGGEGPLPTRAGFTREQGSPHEERALGLALLCRLGKAHPHLPASILYSLEELAILEVLKKNASG